MSKYKAIDSQGIFDEEDDVDDFTFLNHPKQGSSGYFLGNSSSKRQSEAATKQQQLMDELDQIEKRTLESSKRSLGLVHESEQVGISTAESLLRQREQLENCDKRVTDINSSLRVSQKHLTAIQSVFAGFKNMFSKSTPVEPSATASKSSADTKSSSLPSAALGAAMDNVKSQPNFKPAVHPALKLRGLDDDDDEDERFLSSASNGRANKVQHKLDQNLDDLTMGLGRLKGLAMGLGDEIDEQNDLIDRVMKGAEKADMGIERQNRQMKKILGK